MPRTSYPYPKYTPEDIDRIIRESVPYNDGGLNGPYRPPFYEGLIGKELKLSFYEGFQFHYSFKDLHTLTWWEKDGDAPKEEYYEALSPDEHVVFFLHIIKDSRPQKARMIVWSTDTNQVTAFLAQIGNQYSPREVDREICFGYVDHGTPPTVERHCLTDDLVGRSFIWEYTEQFTIQHIYASQWYSAFVDFHSPIGGMMLDSPCNYVKINDHVYIYSWIEIEGAGVQGFALMNLYTMHDVGCFFGINGSGRFECYTFGAKGKNAGQLVNLAFPNDMGKDLPWPPVRPGREERKEG